MQLEQHAPVTIETKISGNVCPSPFASCSIVLIVVPPGTRVMKYREGQYNKAFLLTFDNGSEVVAKLPNPNAGPRRWTTASEVATIDYVSPTFPPQAAMPSAKMECKTRRTLDLPVPRVLSWSCDPSNPVESEYIIMEKVKGTALANIWFEMRVVEKYKIIEQIVNIEAKSCSANFPAHGCLYYTADMPPESCDSEDKPVPVGDDRGEFCIGPIVDGVLWRDERFEMGLSRGPCEHPYIPTFLKYSC